MKTKEVTSIRPPEQTLEEIFKELEDMTNDPIAQAYCKLPVNISQTEFDNAMLRLAGIERRFPVPRKSSTVRHLSTKAG